MQHFYDGQIRRYITQMVRLMSNFSYKDGKGNLTQIPVMYGDLTRQVANIIRDNSENKIPSAPRMAVYITGLAMDMARLADSSYINKVNIREQAYDSDGKEYLNKEGKNYTVERLMPTPYTLTVNVDIWSTNTDQKLQILEQILMLFNPSLEIQTTDNYIDWTSLSVVNLETLTFSSRSVPVGVDSEIDVATMTFNTPIYISPPVKVKRLGVITQVVQSIFNETKGTIDLDLARPTSQAYDDAPVPQSDVTTRIAVAGTGEIEEQIINEGMLKTDVDSLVTTGHDNYGILVLGTTVKLINKGIVGAQTWTGYTKDMPFDFQGGVTELRLRRTDVTNELVGTVVINPLDEYELTVSWDADSFPADTVMHGPNGDRNKIDYIINPYKTNPTNLKSGNPRILILDSINTSTNVGEAGYDGPDAWKNTDGSDFIASTNDIIEWDGAKWHIVFDASTDDSTVVYTSNLNTSKQYKYENNDWVLAYDGEYQNGTWRLAY
jgi:hypothetical protein|tara:strand:+ start:32 stop:1510 length:1479 start_codon:yes stop_codon:yes gene_type:complete